MLSHSYSCLLRQNAVTNSSQPVDQHALEAAYFKVLQRMLQNYKHWSPQANLKLTCYIWFMLYWWVVFFLIVLSLKKYITEIMQLNCCFWAQGTSHVNIIDEIVSQVPNWCGLCLFRAFLISTGLLEGNKEHCLYSLHCTQCLGVLCYRHKPHVCQILLWM